MMQHHLSEPEAALLIIGTLMMLGAETNRHRALKVLMFAAGCLALILVPLVILIHRTIIHEQTLLPPSPGPTG